MKRQVADWMTREVQHARPTASLMEALEVMAERRIRHLLVLERGELVGIVSNRDMIRGALKDPKRRLDLHRTTLGDVMTETPLHSTSPYATLGDAADVMTRNKVSALPVLEGGHLRGVITSDDVLLAVSLGEHTHRRPDL